MRFGSVCSGIEAASVAWHPLGWRASFLSEIDAFPRAVLKHRFPDVPLRGDFTQIKAGDHDPIDLLVGGTPCQSFSVAGLRGGLGDDRGNLALEYLRLADRLRPRWLAWENVCGVLSSNGGRDFGSILGGMVQLGYGFAYRVLDAQFVRVDSHPRAVPQRRRRVFVVGYLGDWRPAAAVLIEREGLRGDTPPRREAGQGVAGRAGASLAGGVAHSLRGEGFDAGEDGTGRGVSLIASTGPVSHCLNAGAMGRLDYETETLIAFSLRGREGGAMPEPERDGCAPTINAASGGSTRPMVAFGLELGNQGSGGNIGWHDATKPFRTLDTSCPPGIAKNHAVRRLTPLECERLQGFPDDWTDVPYRRGMAADGPRYKALGNSMAVNVMSWIGQRIEMVDKIVNRRAAA